MVTEITDVRVLTLSAVPDEVIAMSFAAMERRSMALIEVACADGTTGYGESWTNYPSWARYERRATVKQGLTPLLRGQDADDVPARHADLIARLGPLGRQWGAPGPITQTISGADIALWDRYGRARHVSVAQLLAEPVRHEVPIYASSLGPSNVAEHARQCSAAGFDFVKLKVGFGRDTDLANLTTVRSTLGQHVQLAVDANQRWTLADAVAMGPALRDADVVWVEEPTEGNALADIEEFHRRTGLGVTLGENLYLRAAFEPYLRSPAVHAVQPDVSKSGGITELFAICERAREMGKPVLPHLYGGAVALAATLQLAGCCAAIERVEYDVRSNPLRDPLMLQAPIPNRSTLPIPTGPGLGIDLNLEAVARVTEQLE